MKNATKLIYLSLLLLVFASSNAEQLQIPGHLVSDSRMELPQRGDTMNSILVKFGNPIKEKVPVGIPPITQWEYSGFNVFFEHQHVIHAINLDTLILPSYK